MAVTRDQEFKGTLGFNVLGTLYVAERDLESRILAEMVLHGNR